MSRPRYVLRILQICVAGLALGLLIRSTKPPVAYSRDFQVDYLSAWALRTGEDPLQPLDVLSARYFPVPTDTFPHPNPHPPLLWFLALPLTAVSFPVALRCWLAVNVVLLIPIGRRLGLSPTASLALAAWPPLWCVLALGQLEVVILALLLFGWHAAERGRDWRAGFAFGLAGGLKFYPLLLLIPYVARRRPHILAGAGVLFALVQLGNLLVVGPSGFLRFYTEIVPEVSAFYAPLAINVSPWGALRRIFGGSADVTPLLYAPWLVAPLAVGCSLAALVALWRLEPEAAPAGVFVLLPTVWYYHPVLCLPQISALLRSGRRAAGMLAAAAVSAVVPLVNALLGATLFAGMAASTQTAPRIVAVVGAIQTAGLVTLLLLSIHPRPGAAYDRA